MTPEQIEETAKAYYHVTGYGLWHRLSSKSRELRIERMTKAIEKGLKL